MEGSPWGQEHARDLFTYEMLMSRELEQDSMLWQTPTIALTAQAFLLTIALNPASSTFSRYLTGFLGILVAAMSMQLLAKHRLLEGLDRYLMKEIELRLGIPALSNREWGFSRNGGFALTGAGAPKHSWFRKRRSYVVWQVGLALFGLVNVAIIVVTWICPLWLS